MFLFPLQKIRKEIPIKLNVHLIQYVHLIFSANILTEKNNSFKFNILYKAFVLKKHFRTYYFIWPS